MEKITIAMPSIMRMLVMTSFWIVGAMAEKECTVDDDCKVGQYCYETSKICVDYTSCKWYNREESSRRSRHPSQCGKCLKGYSASESTFESNGEAESCTRDLNPVEEKDESNSTATWISGGIYFGIVLAGGVFLYLVYMKARYRFPRKPCSTTTEKKRPDSLMAENGNCIASAPLASSFSTNVRNDKHSDAEESTGLSTAKEYQGSFMVESSHPVMAQGFHPPDYVRMDPNYNPGDNQTVQTFPTPDERSSASGGSVLITIPPSAPLMVQEQSDNTTNTALERLGFASTSSGQEESHEIIHIIDSSENSGESESNNSDENRHGNSASIVIMQTVKLYTNFNQGRRGT